MDIETIKMPKEEAIKKLQAYKKRLAKMRFSKANEQVHAEYKAAIEGYEALSEGTVLIDLDDVIRNAPLDEKWRPRLAIARADRNQVYFRWEVNETKAQFTTDLKTWNFNPSLTIAIDMQRTHSNSEVNYKGTLMSSRAGGYAIVPMIPADVRPRFGHLKDFVILWEVEKWADTRISSTPDIDPYLLKHLGGSLYAVIAEWDLTDLERSIMKGRIA